MGIFEFTLGFWLLIKGIRTPAAAESSATHPESPLVMAVQAPRGTVGKVSPGCSIHPCPLSKEMHYCEQLHEEEPWK